MITGKTASGFEYCIDERALDDMELVDAMEGADSGNPLDVSRLARLLLGETQRKALWNHLKKTLNVQRLPIESAVKELLEILGGCSAGKN